MNILEVINRKYEKFSKSEKKVADFVLSNPEKIETNTISKVAIESDTSTSAVLRFCKLLGFEGYKEFRFEVTQYYRNKYLNNSTSENINILDSYIDSYKKSLNLFCEIEGKILEDLADLILASKEIFLVGIYQSGLPAKYFSNALQDLGINSRYEDDINGAAHMANLISRDSTLIYFSISGNQSNFTRSLGELTDSMPANSYLISFNGNSPLEKLFNHSIIVPGNEIMKKSIIDAQSLQLILVEILLNMIHDKIVRKAD
ncbi:SIS domain-containing protein [Streptococcus pneumoniae]|nr:SIS domain-containing protein [Streptococcus pneumoniae]